MNEPNVQQIFRKIMIECLRDGECSICGKDLRGSVVGGIKNGMMMFVGRCCECELEQTLCRGRDKSVN